MLARTCNQKPCELTQFETTWRMALPAARTSCRACHVRFRHDVEPAERLKPNRNKYHAIVAARNRSFPGSLWQPVQKIAGRPFEQGVSFGQPFWTKLAHAAHLRLPSRLHRWPDNR